MQNTRLTSMQPLDLFWHPGRGDNFLTATIDGRNAAKAAGYVQVRREGFVYPPA